MALCSAGAIAQDDKPQLPNGTFDDAFVDCHPWEKGAAVSGVFGKQPVGWCASNVPNSMAGSVCEQVTEGSVKAVKLSNTAALGNGIPAYMTLGTTWATAETWLTNTRNKDGGAFGGIAFNGKPHSLKVVYKRDGKNVGDVSTVVAYLWKGTWKQKSVPSNTAVGFMGWGNATKVDMADRDNNILGIPTAQGGAVSKTSDAVLIASLNEKITGTVSEWQTLEIPFTYYDEEEIPEKLNIVISAAGYLDDGATITEGVSITIDSIELVYKTPTSVDENIADVESPSDSPSYNLSGQRVSTAKGIIVKGGKKYLVK